VGIYYQLKVQLTIAASNMTFRPIGHLGVPKIASDREGRVLAVTRRDPVKARSSDALHLNEREFW
jgi:hypothetical protein